jgi:lactate dehydrogenase-like 2-hydroxyacid dehydrogenase
MPDLLQIGGITETMRQRLAAAFTLHTLGGGDYPADAITHIATNGHDGVPADVMAGLPNLRMISCYGVGYDAIDTVAAAERGILVSHTPDVLNAEVASTTILLMLASFRNFLHDEAHARSGAWENGSAPLSRSADNRRVGILGLGRIGQAIADKLTAFDADIHYHSRSKKDVPYTYHATLADMAAAVEVLICITPGGPATHHIVNTEVMNALGPEGTLINVSRGSVVDEPAMVRALKDGRLGYAALDVFEAEPRIPDALKTMPNVVLLPHVGSATHETRAAMGALVVDNLLDHLGTGKVRTPVPETAHLNA